MGDIHYLKDLPSPPVIRPASPMFPDMHSEIVLPDELFARIGDYTRSQPTGPSPGRIYKKNYGWPADMPDDWYVFICEAEDEEWVKHVPYRVVLESDPLRNSLVSMSQHLHDLEGDITPSS